MEERQQLPMNVGDCWADLTPSITGAGSNPKVAFIVQFMGVASTRGDMKYLQEAAHDLMLTFAQSGSMEEVLIMTKIELKLRQMETARRQQREDRSQPGINQQLNLNLKDGNLSVQDLKADKVLDIHNNHEVNIEKDGGKR
jgi:hypothetical protein